MPTTNLRNEILKTLNYSDIFKYPLSLYQIAYFLNYPIASLKALTNSLDQLVKSKKIVKYKSLYYLNGTKPVNWKQRHKHAKNLLIQQLDNLKYIAQIPWIKMIAITGAVAAYNADQQSDVDILIVTQKNRVWLTRMFVTLILIALGQKTKKDGEKGKLCTNIFISEDNLEWKNKNLYTAREIANLQPIYTVGNIYFEFIKANKWVLKYIKSLAYVMGETTKVKHRKSKLVDYIEKILHKMQLTYMKNRKTKEITKPNIIHFRKHDNAERILLECKKRKLI